ncbi:Sec-independent protein translocase protein TatB [Roseobacteraceae bacterium S113]
MGGLSWGEILIVGIVALIVVGPKDLPVLFRRAGEFVGKMRGMAREFSRAMNDAADESGVRDIQQQIKAATNPVGTAMDGVKDAAKSIGDPLADIDPLSETGKLSAERAEQTAKIQANAARASAERLQKEAEAAMAKAQEYEAKVASNTSKDT